jgi:hypothetical protein
LQQQRDDDEAASTARAHHVASTLIEQRLRDERDAAGAERQAELSALEERAAAGAAR